MMSRNLSYKWQGVERWPPKRRSRVCTNDRVSVAGVLQQRPAPSVVAPRSPPTSLVAIRSQSMPAASASTCRSRSCSLSSPARARGHCGGRTEGRRPLQLVMFTDVSRNLCDSVYTGGNPVAVFGARRHLEGLRAGWTRIRAGSVMHTALVRCARVQSAGTGCTGHGRAGGGCPGFGRARAAGDRRSGRRSAVGQRPVSLQSAYPAPPGSNLNDWMVRSLTHQRSHAGSNRRAHGRPCARGYLHPVPVQFRELPSGGDLRDNEVFSPRRPLQVE
jgi:hypothetical protein